MIVCAVNEGRRALLLPALLSLFAAIPFFLYLYSVACATLLFGFCGGASGAYPDYRPGSFFRVSITRLSCTR